jgi:hypothetical protein
VVPRAILRAVGDCRPSTGSTAASELELMECSNPGSGTLVVARRSETARTRQPQSH